MNTWLKRALIAGPVLIVLFFGAVLFYVNVIREDAPDELDADDPSRPGITTEDNGLLEFVLVFEPA